jgi:serine phosphatase RsbU (regulator of sigma subunit)
MESQINPQSPERRQYVILIGLAVIVGILMWQSCIERLAIPQSHGWAIILLLECVGMNFLALGLFALMLLIGRKVGLFHGKDSEKKYILRNRILKFFFGLVAISGSIAVATPLLFWQLRYFGEEDINQFLLGYSTLFGYHFGGILALPYIAFVAILLIMMFQPFVTWIKTSARQRSYVFIGATLLALVPLLLHLHIPRYDVPYLVEYYPQWFTSLRHPRVPLQNDLVVVVANTQYPLDLLKVMIGYNPKKVVMIIGANLMSDTTFNQIDSILKDGQKILITGYSIKNVKTNFKHLQFAPMWYFWWTIPITRMRDDDDSLTAPFFLARERNALFTDKNLKKYEDEGGSLIFESYFRWGSIAKLVVTDNTDGWNTYDLGKIHISKEKNGESYSNSSNDSWTLDSLRGKTLIFDYCELPEQQYVLGETIAKIVLNIEQNNFIYRISSKEVALLGLFILVLNIFCYYRLRPWSALGSTIVCNVILFAGVLLIYTEWSILFNIMPIMVSIGLFTLVVFPYELVRERSQQLKERIRLETELKAARETQFGLMPVHDPEVPGFDINGLCVPAYEVGGDFYDYVWLDEEKIKLGIAVADVSGKAMKAAMTAVMTSGLVYSEVGSGESPKSILRKINRPMYLKTDRRVFTALSFAVIDTKTRELIFSNAGQMTPLLRRGDTLQSITVEGPRLPLGIQEVVDYNEVTMQLQSGDILVLFTDGIVEAKNIKEELWGFEQMEQAVRNLPQSLTAKEMGETLFAEANKFAGTAKQHDDMTIVVVRVL